MHPTVLAPALPSVAVGAAPLPDDLRPERPRRLKDRVKHDLEVVARAGVTVQVQGAARLEDAVHLHHALAHPGDVVPDTALPAVLERPDLGLVAPDDLVAPVGEEGWIEVDEVDAVRRKVPQSAKVVVPIQDACLEIADRCHGRGVRATP